MRVLSSLALKSCGGSHLIFLEIEPGKNGFVIVSQKINFHSFSFQIAMYLTLFVIGF